MVVRRSGKLGYASAVVCGMREALRLDRIHTEGYAFLIGPAFIRQYNGFRIGEIPIRFVDRQYGRFNISRQIILEALWLVLRLGRLRQPEAYARGYLR